MSAAEYAPARAMKSRAQRISLATRSLRPLTFRADFARVIGSVTVTALVLS
jgi:hypothetical protein